MSFALSLARLAARAKRAGIDRVVLQTLTVGETLTLIREADKERRAWERLADMRSASQMALLANCHRKKGTRAYKPADFMPADEDEEDARELTDAEQEAQLIQMARTLGAA